MLNFSTKPVLLCLLSFCVFTYCMCVFSMTGSSSKMSFTENIFVCKLFQLCIRWMEDMRISCTLEVSCLAKAISNETYCFQVMGYLLLSQ